MKTGTIGIVGLSHLQCVLWTSERFSKWKQKTETFFHRHEVLSIVDVLISHLGAVENGNRRDSVVCVFGHYVYQALCEKRSMKR